MLPADASLAVHLVNSEEPATGTDALRTLEDMRAWLAALPGPLAAWGAARSTTATAADQRGLRRLRGRLRPAFEAAGAGDEAAAAAVVNGLLRHAPVRPVLAPVNGQWRLALADDSPSLVTSYLAVAVLGLAQAIEEGALSRMGVCAALGCRVAYLDDSPKGARRYCSSRCASRSHVAAHRARRRETSPG